ncbi:hypothetical protein [Moraxella ovis]|uniref:hypothetical protein n=1 Tax=Moraxella ovis TaxID=29433 RepID=UPI0007B89680|nr:hypothetical protein [Moraxella ovis]
MKEISLKQELIKNISLAKNAGVKYDELLSQNLLAVTPNGLNWLFLRPNTAKAGIGVSVSPSYTQTLPMLANFRPFMVWLILQNKPVGEYVKRFLVRPRVRPHRPFMGKLLKTLLGASIMTAFLTGILAKNSLAKSHELGNNTATTKRKAVKPNRHSLAIFMPKAGVNASSQDKHAPSWAIRALSSVFGGLIGVNTKPKGNSPSRLFAVVETCHPIYGVVSLTKRKGNPTVNNTVIHHSLTVLADEYHRHSELHTQNSLAKSHELGNNTATTKLLHGCTPSNSAFLLSKTRPTNTALIGCVSNFVGLIVQNTIALVVNMHSRVVTVVETQRPICGRVHSLTKFTTMNNSILHHSLTVLADEYHRHSELHAQNPYAGHGDRANAIHNAMNELVKLMNEQDGASVPPKPKTITERIVALFSTPAIRVFAKGGAR